MSWTFFFFRFGCLQFVFSITNYEDDIDKDKNDEADFSLRSETKTEIKNEEIHQDEDEINSNSNENNEFINDTKESVTENNVEMKDEDLWEEEEKLMIFYRKRT